MKRTIIILLVLSMVMSFCACRENAENLEAPATFYYLQPMDALDLSKSVLQSEIRETAHLHGQLEEILNVYLAGPVSDAYVSPFPADVFVLSAEQYETKVVVTLSKMFSQLEGYERSIGNICLAMTVLELTGCEEVVLTTNGEADSVTITRELLYLMDQNHADP